MMRMTELADFLRAHDDYCVFGHVNPDGDAVGSCVALALALRALGKRAFVYLPGGMPKMYSMFACSSQIVCDENVPFVPKTAFAADVSDPERLGGGKALFDACGHSCMLDHHATNRLFGEVCLVDGNAAATGELAVELIRELGVTLTAEMAQWLYIAIVTDCGQFGYSSTRAETMIAAAECLRAGADADAITREIYRTRSEGRTRLLGTVLSNIRREGEICWSYLTNDMFRAAGAIQEDNEGAVNYLLEIRGVEFSCLAEERGSATKFSLRSKGKIDVAKEVAQPLGGGGHACAAGVTIEKPMREALQTVLDMARRALAGK